MKKLLSLVLVFILSVSLCSCSVNDEEFVLDLSYWSNPKESNVTVPLYYRGNAVITVADGVDIGGQKLAEIIESTSFEPVDNVDLSKYDIPQLIFQAEFVKAESHENIPIQGSKAQPEYVIRFYDDFKYMAVFSDSEGENQISPVYAIKDNTALKEHYKKSTLYITAPILDKIKSFMAENFDGKDRDYIQPYISDMLLPFFLEEIPENIVVNLDYDNMYASVIEDRITSVMGYVNFEEDVYSYIVFTDTDDNGNLSTGSIMFMLFTDNP